MQAAQSQRIHVENCKQTQVRSATKSAHHSSVIRRPCFPRRFVGIHTRTRKIQSQIQAVAPTVEFLVPAASISLPFFIATNIDLLFTSNSFCFVALTSVLLDVLGAGACRCKRGSIFMLKAFKATA